MAFRYRIRHLLAAIAIMAVLLAMFTPEIRSWDRYAQAVVTVAVVVSIYFAVSFTPVWIVLLRLRNRSRRGLKTKMVDYVVVLGAIFLGFGLLIFLGFATKRLVVK